MDLKPHIYAFEPGSYPPDWETVPLRDVGEWFSGGTPRKSNASYWGGGIPWISAKDMKQHCLHDSTQQITDLAVKAGARLMPKHSVLMVIRGMILAHTFPVAKAECQVAFNQDLKAVLVAESFDSSFVLHWLSGNAQRILALVTESTHGTKRLSPETLFRVPFPRPSKDEQAAIAAAISDVDEWIDSLQHLLVKKRQIKQGAMQELLTGCKRLPGYSTRSGYQQTEVGLIPRDWILTPLGRLVRSVDYGSSAKSCISGAIPVLRMGNLQDGKIDWSDLVYTNDSTEIDKYLLQRGDVLFNRTNTIDLVGKTAIYDGSRPAIFAGYLIRINVLSDLLDQRFLAYTMNTEFARKHSQKILSVAVGQANINAQKLRSYPIPLPSMLHEQVAIATVLSDMDADIEAVESSLAKARLVKQGMMQELLTGRMRLVKPTPATHSMNVPKEPATGKPHHNSQIEDAVIIGILVNRFGNEERPLGHVRRTKLTYLFERHSKGKAAGYLKKAAGPYKPATKYKGPMGIAFKNGYVREHANGQFTGLVAGANVAQAESYFSSWFDRTSLDWLEQFRFRKTEELELLATVDMAIQELRSEGKAPEMLAVKRVIGDHPEWEAKLNRAVFSDASITRAIEHCQSLFPE